MHITKELIHKLPKSELHCHLDGSLRILTILDLADNQDVHLPAHNENDLTNLLFPSNKPCNLEEYLQKFDITLSVLQTADGLERCTYELIEDASHENIRYIEIRYSPILNTGGNMTMNETVDAVRSGIERGKKDFGTDSAIIICGMQHASRDFFR